MTPPAASVPLRPRLKPTVEPFAAPGGDLYLLRPNAPDVAVRAPDPAQRALLERLDGLRPAPEVIASVRAEGHAIDDDAAAATLAQLHAAGLVEDAAPDDALEAVARERFDRQLRYFGDAVAPGVARAAIQQRLEQASVVVLGVGGLGCWAAYALASAGVGRLVVVDGDRVELINLNRQILFGADDLGRPKATAAAERLRAYAPSAEVVAVDRHVTGPGDVARLVGGHDLVLDLADTPVGELQRWVDAACFAAGVPYAAAGQMPPLARVGPLYVPGHTGCFACQEAAWRVGFALYDEVDRWRRGRASPAATYGPACGLIGSILANDAVNLITGLAEPASLGRALLIDFNTLERSEEEVRARPDCERCG